MSQIFLYKNKAPDAAVETPTVMIFSYNEGPETCHTVGYNKDFQQVWSNKHLGLMTKDAAILPDGTHYLLQESTGNSVLVMLKKYSPTHELLFEKTLVDLIQATAIDYDLTTGNIIITGSAA